MIKVQLADDNTEFVIGLANYLTKDENIKVINTTFDGNDTLHSYLHCPPDVLVLDINMPKLNGAQILDILCNSSYEERNKCNVLVLSGNLPYFTFQYVSKIYRIFEKPCTMEMLLSAIYEIYENNNKKPNCRMLCKGAVLKLGFNINSIGTSFLVDAIEMLYNRNSTVFSMDSIYEEISITRSTPMKKVKWNMEKAINSMFRYSNKKTLLEIFPNYDGRKPTPKYAISMALYELRKRLLH